MAWSSAFMRALLDPGNNPRMHRVRAVPAPAGVGTGELWQIDTGAASEGVVIGMGGTTAGASVDIGSWSSTMGSWTVELLGDAAPLKRKIWRGQPAVHEVSLNFGKSWEAVQIGTVYELEASAPGVYTLHMRDMVGSLQSRYAATQSSAPLFYTVGTQTLLNGAYVAGEASTGVDLVTDLDRPATVLGVTSALIVVDPDSDWRFFIRYTGVDVGTNHTTGNSGSVYNTTQAARPDDTIVKDCGFIEEHPLRIIQKILVSRGGSGVNGPYDTLPSSWGYGLPTWMVDHDDIAHWVPILSPATGADDWTLIVEEPIDDGLAYLQAWLARAGMFIVTRQGRLTVRGAMNPVDIPTGLDLTPYRYGTIRGEDVDPDSIEWSAWDGGQGQEYGGIAVATSEDAEDAALTTLYEDVTSHPARDVLTVDLRDTVYSNHTAWKSHIRVRLAAWTLRLCERLSIECLHPQACALTPGDIVQLEIPYFGGRSDPGGYAGRAGMVTSVDPDFWGGGSTRLTIAVPVRETWPT